MQVIYLSMHMFRIILLWCLPVAPVARHVHSAQLVTCRRSACHRVKREAQAQACQQVLACSMRVKQSTVVFLVITRAGHMSMTLLA